MTPRHALTLIAAISIAVALAGCSDVVRLTAADDGGTVRLASGGQLNVSLDSNPTTGYQWAIDGDLPPQLERAAEVKYTPDSKAVGSGGTEVWAFFGREAGTGTLRMKYWRSFEPTAAPADTFSVEVVVE